jgi:hypothetical protein
MYLLSIKSRPAVVNRASCTLATAGYFPENKGKELESDHLHTSSTEDKNSGVVTTVHHTSLWRVA